MSYYWFSRQELLQKAKNRYHNGSGKKKLLNLISRNREVLGEEAKIGTKACQKKKKKQKKNTVEIGIEIRNKMQATRVLKK